MGLEPIESGRCWCCRALIPACRDLGLLLALDFGLVAKLKTVGATATDPTTRR
jgi:hypothetical protein